MNYFPLASIIQSKVKEGQTKDGITMILSEKIAELIEDMLNEQGGTLEIRRNELASQMGCVPSQINYVITSRFTPQNGYLVESRRGGGGYLRISRVEYSKSAYLMQFYNAIGDSIDFESSKMFISHLLKSGYITAREAEIMVSPLTEKSLSRIAKEERNQVRAMILKAMIIKLTSM